jgi:hypothetical protein
VDLRATPVVRLVRTLAHYWLQGRVRISTTTDPQDMRGLRVHEPWPRLTCGHGRRQIIGISIKKIRPGPAAVKSGPCRAAVRRARTSPDQVLPARRTRPPGGCRRSRAPRTYADGQAGPLPPPSPSRGPRRVRLGAYADGRPRPGAGRAAPSPHRL